MSHEDPTATEFIDRARVIYEAQQGEQMPPDQLRILRRRFAGTYDEEASQPVLRACATVRAEMYEAQGKPEYVERYRQRAADLA